MRTNSGDFGLSQKTIASICQIFSNYPAIQKAILYGSRAKGNYRHGSDIDLTLIGDLSHQDLNRIETQLDDLLLPYMIDLSLFKDIENSELIDHVHRVGKTFYLLKHK